MRVQLRSKVRTDFAGQPLKDEDVGLLVQRDCDLYKPDGELLGMLRRRAVPQEITDAAYPTLSYLKKYKTDNRGAYTGAPRYQGAGSDKQSRTRDPETGEIIQISSAIIGYFDRQGGRFPFCRATAFTANEVEKWTELLPMVRHVSGVFEQELPERFAVQKAMADKTSPDFVITGTPFTTLTVNNNIAGATHKDKGDFKDGFGIIGCVRRGKYSGGILVFPEYEVGVDLQDGDLFFFNSHDWHGVTAFHDCEEGWERISVVYYFRERMINCGSCAEELARAKSRMGKI